MEEWFSRKVVADIVGNWKKENVDQKEPFHILEYLLGTTRQERALALKGLAVFTAERHSKTSEELAAELGAATACSHR